MNSTIQRGRIDPGIRKVLVVGAGRSGVAAARALLAQGRSVVLSDSREAAELDGDTGLEGLDVARLAGPQDIDQLAGVDLLIKSPGVPGEIALVEAARARRIPVWSELELAYRLLPNPFTAITGTNGKTTTTTLIGHMFQVAGRPARVLGNVGTPVSAVVGEVAPEEELVVEVSSFQLEDVDDFRPRTAVFLNLTPDHLDRHGTLQAYLACKARLFASQGPDDSAVINVGDEAGRDLAVELDRRAVGPRILRVSTGSPEPGLAAWLAGDRLHFAAGGSLPVAELTLRGRHNHENCLAAGAAGLARGLDFSAVAEALRTFPGVAHRLQMAGTAAGVAYVNDSKATNVEAALKALDAYPAGTHLILGGRDKASDYRPLAERCREVCRAVYLIGEAAPLIATAFGEVGRREGLPPLIESGDLETAVADAAKRARPGEVVLLAPACASFDQYRDFEERGEHFMKLVREQGVR